MSLRVECRAGWRADEAPVAVHLEGRRHEVRAVLATWLEEAGGDRSRRRLFRVRLADGDTVVLAHDEGTDTWSLVGPAPAPGGLLLVDDPALRGREQVFRDRSEGGRVLGALLLAEYRGSGALVLAVPAGGVPVGIEVAGALGLELDLAVTSKVTLPWSTESGCGAVAFDGTLLLDDRLLARAGLDRSSVGVQVEAAAARVRRRMERFRGGRPVPDVAGRRVIVVDDGLASGITMTATLEALRRAGARESVVAVPTGHRDSVRRLAGLASQVVCANLRGGPVFAVADAYEEWRDLDEEEVEALLGRDRASSPPSGP